MDISLDGEFVYFIFCHFLSFCVFEVMEFFFFEGGGVDVYEFPLLARQRRVLPPWSRDKHFAASVGSRSVTGERKKKTLFSLQTKTDPCVLFFFLSIFFPTCFLYNIGIKQRDVLKGVWRETDAKVRREGTKQLSLRVCSVFCHLSRFFCVVFSVSLSLPPAVALLDGVKRAKSNGAVSGEALPK